MIVKNPTDSELSIMVKGVTYTVGANGELANVPAEVAIHWQGRIHNFIQISDDVAKAAPKAEVKVEEKKEEKKEEVNVEPVVVTEEPKAESKKTK